MVTWSSIVDNGMGLVQNRNVQKTLAHFTPILDHRSKCSTHKVSAMSKDM